MTWHSVASPAEADELLRTFGGFHDACVRDVYLWTGYSVDDSLSMCVPQKDIRCRVLVQRQFANPSAVELLFDNVLRLTLLDHPGCDRIIFRATLAVAPGQIIWSPDDVAVENLPGAHTSVIVAERMWWRTVENGLGEVLRLVPFGELPPSLAR